MKLIVAEKHSVGENIAKIVGASQKKSGYSEGNGYVVTWCVGHLVRLSLPDKYGEKYENYWTFDNLPIIPSDWKFELNKETAHQFKVVKDLMSRNDIEEIVCATDAGREGECIFRYVYNYAKCQKPVLRLWISSMEDKAIREGMNNLQPDCNYDNLFAAGFARAKADWLVGMNGSRLMSNRYGTPLNVGRVQTPVLAMVVQRDYDISHFVKQKFYNVLLNCGKLTVSSGRIDDENTANHLAEICSGKNAVVSEVKKEIKTINPPALYDLTTLQREANKQFGYTAKQTLEYTQSLYEAKLVTYPRTDSQYLTEDMEQTALNMVKAVQKFIPKFNFKITNPDVKRCLNNKKVSDHTAIIPTAEIQNNNLDELPNGEKNILFLIAGKLLTATAEPHKYEAVKVTVQCENADFSANGKTVLNNGFKGLEKFIRTAINGKADNSEEEKENKLPEITEGQNFENVISEVTTGFTAPPKTFTENTLLKAMETVGNSEYDENSDVEKKGLGTPATRADIIENLVNRGYIQRDKKKVTATEKGVKLIEVVPDEVKSPKLTADWETELQHIEQGKASVDGFMQEIEQYVKDLVNRYSSKADNGFASGKEPIGTCPRCGKNIYEGKLNYYCESGKDSCGFSIWKKNKYPEADIDVQTAKKFLTDGKAELKTKDKSGKPYTAMFEMVDTGKYINFNYCKTEKVSLGKCPSCGKDVFENAKSYSCGDKECKCIIWKSICGKNISDTQVKKLLDNGRSDLIKGFKTKAGKEFDAYLVFKDDMSIGLKFADKGVKK